MKLVDTHCHLDFRAFDEDRSQVVERAREQGVERILVPGIDLETSRSAVSLANAFPDVFAAVGVHPNSAGTWQNGSIEELAALTQNNKVVAIGEIGIDYFHMRVPADLQGQVFSRQLDLAKAYSLPVIIHSRNPSDGSQRALIDVLAILRGWQADLIASGSVLAGQPGVLHSFSGTIDQAFSAIDMGFYIGITGPVTFNNANGLRDLVAELPVNRILIETDAPFLTPHPYRGTRNEPAYVRLVADKIAEVINKPVDSFAQATLSNAERLFKWRVIHPAQ